MNKHIIKTMFCILLVFATNVGLSADSAITQQTEQVAVQAVDSGRSDPFASSFTAVQESQPAVVTPVQNEFSKPSLFVKTITLKFLSATNLKNALDKMVSSFGSIGVDDNTNTLIICDTKENVERILEEVRNADKTPSQIMIEVVIVDVQLKDDTEIGVDWDILSSDNKDFGYRQSMVFPNRLSVVGPTSTTLGDMTAFTPVGLGSEISIVTHDIRNILQVLQEKRDIDILASPRVMVVSGQKAEIKTIEQIPYQQITQSSAGGGGARAITSTEFKDIGVTMEVKATVTDEGKILLVIKPEQSVSTGTSIGGVPVIDKRGASTTLLMDDGQVVVMGGLRRQETSHIKTQVPLLGDLPLIGFIFSDNRTIVENSELLVLLSPHVYKGQSVSAAEMARYNQAKENSLINLPAESKSGKRLKK